MADKFHINDKGEVGKCTAKKKCRFGGESGVDNHFSTMKEAQDSFEKDNKNRMFSNVSKKEAMLYSQMLRNNNGRYPEEVLKKLSSYLSQQSYDSLTVIPAGSALYNTSIPGRKTHDYDFTVIATPHASLKKNTQKMFGELDVLVIDVIQQMKNFAL